MDKQEAIQRPNFGTTTELRNGTVTVTNPDGSQTVKTLPADPAQKATPSK
jgi:hypothetical protein